MRTSVAFIHLAAPIRLPVTHPPPPGRSQRGGAQTDTRAGTPGPRGPLPLHRPGTGSSSTPLPELCHPGRHTPSIQPWELVGRTEGRGRTSPVQPLPLRLAECLSVWRGGQGPPTHH